jgi:exodeoxyribonuclease VII large subunit
MFNSYSTDSIIQNEFSVSEISHRIKSLLEEKIGTVRIKGEISGLKIASSGHCYFSLKDDNAILAATCWKHVVSKINFRIEEGLEIIATGNITAYAGQSKYQISVTAIEPAGIGAFMKILQERKEKLMQEGLFAKEHKKKLPFLPRKIGIITSLTGAVIRDIIHRISDRCPSNLVIWPVSVQGATSAGEVTNAVIGFNNLSSSERPDVIIIARGGGSIEDLWSFNDENLIRAVFTCNIPVISAIGHETDYTLLDLVADLRAPTPTAAAEFAVPILKDLQYTLRHYGDRLPRRIEERLDYYGTRLSMLRTQMSKSRYIMDAHTQRLDELELRLNSGISQLIKNRAIKLLQFATARLAPNKLLQYKALNCEALIKNFKARSANMLNIYQHRLELSGKLLDSLDYHNVLKRGFSILYDANNNIITSKIQLQTLDKIKIRLQDGEAVYKLTDNES